MNAIKHLLLGSIVSSLALVSNSGLVANELESQPQMTTKISAEFPYTSRYIEVLGSKMHYVEEGSGDPVLFLHGNPTSSYLWRNIIPYISDDARAIAVDLIGMGKSDKPNIEYSYADQAKYLYQFIEELNLKNVTLVVHDWGSGLGFNYAATHSDNIKGIVFMESLIAPFTWDTIPAEGAQMIKTIRTPRVGEDLIMKQNFFIEKFLPSAIMRPLTDPEMNVYRAPYPTEESRRPVWKWPTEIPISGTPENVHKIVANYHQWLQETSTPKLLLAATPGVMIKEKEVNWAKQNMDNLDVVNVGRGLHFIQEDNPDAIGQAISNWYQTLNRQGRN